MKLIPTVVALLPGEYSPLIFQMTRLAIVQSLLLMLLFGASSADADIVTLDFETPAFPGISVTNIGSSYSQNGVTLTTASPAFLSIFSDASSVWTGSQTIANSTATATTNVALDTPGNLFTPISIDIADFHDTAGQTINFIGTLANDNIVTASITTDGLADIGPGSLDTYSFPTSFENLKALSWSFSTTPTTHFDNFVLEITTIPEPSTLFLGAFAVVGLFVRRNRRTDRMLVS